MPSHFHAYVSCAWHTVRACACNCRKDARIWRITGLMQISAVAPPQRRHISCSQRAQNYVFAYHIMTPPSARTACRGETAAFHQVLEQRFLRRESQRYSVRWRGQVHCAVWKTTTIGALTITGSSCSGCDTQLTKAIKLHLEVMNQSQSNPNTRARCMYF